MAIGRERGERAGLIGLAHRICEIWALLGGLVLMALVLMNAYSLVAGVLFHAPFAGEYEMVEVGVAIAAFAFLPYCQIEGAHVSADIFTARASRRTVALLMLLGAIVAFLVALLLLWRMYFGLEGYIRYEERTAIMGFPIWIAFLPILVSLALWAVAALVTVVESASEAAAGRDGR
ncbi:MAG: TRAP transporter small permease [Azospirillaceae bacterium]